MTTIGRELLSLARRYPSWIAPGGMIVAIACNEAIRQIVDPSPIMFFLFSAATLYAGLSGFRAAIASSLLLCCYLLYSTLTNSGPPVLTGNFVQVSLASIAILAIAGRLGLSTDRNRALISSFETTQTELIEARTALERKVEEATRELRLREARLTKAQQVGRIGSFERDLSTNEESWSDEAYRIFGIEPKSASLAYDRFLERVHPDDRERVVEMVAKLVDDGERFDSQFRIARPDGEERLVHGIAEVRFDEDGEPAQITGIAQDVTERIELEREVLAIGERERNRIGTDLHDGLGQELTGISLALQSLSRQFERENSPHAASLQDIIGVVQNTIREARGYARQLAPVFLAEQGLCAALKSLADDIDRHSTATCEAHSNYDGEIHDANVATHLYRIAQEGISNALKHGSANTIDLTYGRDGDSVYLEIVDDGTGIPKEGEFSEGMGMRNMRFRTHMLQGKLDIGPRPQGGTRIRCTCPYPFH